VAVARRALVRCAASDGDERVSVGNGLGWRRVGLEERLTHEGEVVYFNRIQGYGFVRAFDTPRCERCCAPSALRYPLLCT
jgi:hypothetical protein